MPFLKLIETIAVIKFLHVSKKHNGDADAIFTHLLRDGLDKESLGFWVWDLTTNRELYSPKFRAALGYEGEHDFPSVANSWQGAITQKSLDAALANLMLHIDTKGVHKYNQIVTYNKKNGGQVTVDSHGAVVHWSDDSKPLTMVGVHLKP